MSRIDNPGAGTVRRQSVGYLVTLAAAMVGIVCLAVAIQGTRRVLHNSDGLGAFNQAGVPALICALGLNFYARLAFSNKVSAASQARVRLSLQIVFALVIITAIVGSWFVLTTGAASADLRGILVVGDLLQIGTLLWVWRYSRE